MDYYNEGNNAHDYMEMTKDETCKVLVHQAITHFKKGMKVLELGSGAGRDLKILDEYFKVVGSDNAEPFIKHLKDAFYDLRILRLNAITMDTHKKFDAIYSNKVLHHLNQEDLKISFENQSKVLNEKGMMIHGFWQRIDNPDIPSELIFNVYNEESIKEYIPDCLELIHFESYDEFTTNDSFFIFLKKK